MNFLAKSLKLFWVVLRSIFKCLRCLVQKGRPYYWFMRIRHRVYGLPFLVVLSIPLRSLDHPALTATARIFRNVHRMRVTTYVNVHRMRVTTYVKQAESFAENLPTRSLLIGIWSRIGLPLSRLSGI
jgi:hypothetical protein